MSAFDRTISSPLNITREISRTLPTSGLKGDVSTSATTRGLPTRLPPPEPPPPISAYGLTWGGFTDVELAGLFGWPVEDVVASIRVLQGNPTTDDQSIWNSMRMRMTTPDKFFGTTNSADYAYKTLEHFTHHPKGSHYHGDINVVDLVANVATGGLYGVVKAGVNLASGGKVLPNIATAFAVTGPAGSALQPTIGTKKTLILEAAVVTAAIGSAPAKDLPFGGLSLVGAGAGGGAIGAALLSTGKSVFTSLVNSIGTPGQDVRGASPGAPIMPTLGFPTYFVSGSGSGSGSGFVSGPGSGAEYGTQGGLAGDGRNSAPATILSSPLLPLAAFGLIGLFLLLRRARHGTA